MHIVTQDVMNRLFDVTDELPLSREAITVPLEMAGEGEVGKTKAGRFEITLPAPGALDDFLAGLPERLRALGLPPAPEGY